MRLSPRLLFLCLAACSNGGPMTMTGPEVINGVTVPPAPDPTLNTATVAGVDSNANGVRDDIERLIATELGADADALAFAKTEEAAITSTSPETVRAHLALLDCITDEARLEQLSKITLATMDTPVRRSAYGIAFAGATLSGKGCTP